MFRKCCETLQAPLSASLIHFLVLPQLHEYTEQCRIEYDFIGSEPDQTGIHRLR
jgi:hypothetical protein